MPTPSSDFSLDFGHFNLEILKNIKKMVGSLKKCDFWGMSPHIFGPGETQPPSLAAAPMGRADVKRPIPLLVLAEHHPSFPNALRNPGLLGVVHRVRSRHEVTPRNWVAGVG